MFNETRLLDSVAYGSVFGQEFKTDIVQLRSGAERRNADWSMPLGRYSVIFDALEPKDHWKVRDAFMSSLGSAIGFRFKDWTDFIADGEVIGFGKGVEQNIQLTKAYKFGSTELKKIIQKPVVGTVNVYSNEVATPFTINYNTGVIVVTAPSGSVITWSGEFDIPVRFESDRLDLDPITTKGSEFYLTSDVDLVEIRV